MFLSNLVHSVLLWCYISVHSYASEVPRPRGVPLSRASLYRAGNFFTCLDNSKSIPFSEVNDDYCHCPDGSDEPGTSACINGAFYCMNKGHHPKIIKSSRVNDIVCDCCDGSDEYQIYAANCTNNCMEMGEAARLMATREAEKVKIGIQQKNEFSAEGKERKQQKILRKKELEEAKIEAETLKAEKQAIKEAADKSKNDALEFYRKIEEEENAKKAEMEEARTREVALNAFAKFDLNADGFIEISELVAQNIFNKDQIGDVPDDAIKSAFNHEEKVSQEQFIEFVWKNLKPLLMTESDDAIHQTPKQDDVGDGREPETIDDDNVENAVEETDEEQNEDEPSYDEDNKPQTEYQPQDSPVYDRETQRLIDEASEASQQFNDADQSLRNIQTEITSIEDYLNNDYGVDEEFSVLNGQCFDFDHNTYTYKLCPFNKIQQVPKSGGGDINLGYWGRWTGPDDNKYLSMIFENGQNCWDGPARKTEVNVTCNTENIIFSVSEPSRCTYFMEFGTPAVCNEIATEYEVAHDEL